MLIGTAMRLLAKHAEGGEVKQVVEALKELPLPMQIFGVATIRKTVEGIEITTDGAAATGRVTVSATTVRTLLGIAERAIPSAPGRAPNGG